MAQVKRYNQNGTATLQTVKVGDVVCFKSDFEQSGQIIKIERHEFGGGWILTLENPDGFGGEYLRYAVATKERASDCWVEC